MLSTLCPWAMWMLLMGGVLVMQQNHKVIDLYTAVALVV
jgi:hypothetical protein